MSAIFEPSSLVILSEARKSFHDFLAKSKDLDCFGSAAAHPGILTMLPPDGLLMRMPGHVRG
ncbi:MAG TPA: hypothetical protein VFM77_08970, partial [Terriglobales bacterium]|nr:hypothetical protein [Terriglobales bacterium]